MGRSRHTKGGQHKANKNQNKKARRTVRSVKKAVSRVTKNVRKKVGDISSKVKKGFSVGKDAYGNALRGAAANAATHIANSQYNKQLKQANWTKRDMSKLTPQQQRKYDRLSKITGRDYSTRVPGMKINLSADRLAQFGGFADSGWYKGITKAIPGIKSLRINKQLYSNPMKKGWHSSQRMGRGQGVKDISSQLPAPVRGVPGGRTPNMGPEPDWLSDLYRSHNISGGKLDQGARDYWSNEAKTKGRDAVIQSIIGTSKAQGTYGGRKKPQRIDTGRTPRIGHWGIGIPGHAGRFLGGHVDRKRTKRKAKKQNQATERQYKSDKKSYNMNKKRMAKSLAASVSAIRGGV